jgi:hypothetical protein
MATTNAGAILIATLVEADGPYYVGAGNSSTAFNAAQTDLQGASKARVVASASRSTNTITYSSVFDTSTGNFEWLEVALFDASTSGTMLTRKVVALPTKSSSEEWTINLEVVFAAA